MLSTVSGPQWGLLVSVSSLPPTPLSTAGVSTRKWTFVPSSVTTSRELPQNLQRKGPRESPECPHWLHLTSPEACPRFCMLAQQRGQWLALLL